MKNKTGVIQSIKIDYYFICMNGKFSDGYIAKNCLNVTIKDYFNLMISNFNGTLINNCLYFKTKFDAEKAVIYLKLMK